MKRTVVLFLMIWIALFAIQAQEISRIENSPYPISTQKPDKLFLISESIGYSQKLTLQSLQGMLARTKPEILRDTHGHVDLLSPLVTIDRTYYSNFNGLLAHYSNRFDGYILCKARTASVNVAFSLCPIYNAIMIPEDIEHIAKQAGYSLVIDVRDKDESWVIANYKDQLNKSIVSYQAFNDDRALFLGDYSVFSNALQFWDDSATGPIAKAAYSMMNPLAIYFGWGAGEYQTVEQISQYSAMIHPSDWSPNLSTLSNIPTKMPRQKVAQTEFEVVPNVHTVCFVISDGDNIQWLSGSLNNKNNWSNPDKERLKLGWTISPSYVELAPTSYNKYIEKMVTTEHARNYLIAGPSGAGYYFPGIYPELANQTKYMNDMLEKSDINIVNIIDKDGYHNPNLYLAQSNVDALFYYSYGGQYTKIGGQIRWYKDKPSIGGRFTLWGNSSDSSAETKNRVAQSLANTLNKQSTNINSSDGYSLIPVHIWTMNPTDVLNCISKLNPNIRVVAPDEFVWLIRKNIRKLNLASGNGLRGEYALKSNPNTILATTNERTVEFNDEYLTDGSAAVDGKVFTAKWEGKVQAIYSEKYTFHTSALGGAKLKINGRILCDSLNNSTVNSSDTITLESGKKYEIEFIFQKNAPKAKMTLEWESASQVRQRIPHYQLFSQPLPSTGSVTAYDANNFEGFSSEMKLGDYTAEKLEEKGFETNKIHSLKVSDGYKLILYDQDDFKGNSLTITEDNPDLGDWINKLTSLKVQSNGLELDEQKYFIKPHNNANTMGVEGGYLSFDNGKKIKLFRNTGAINLQFRFIPVAEKVYRIESVSSGKSLEIENFSKEEQAHLQQWSETDASNQHFIIVPTETENVYRILSCNSGMILEASTLSATAQILQTEDTNQSNALWELEAVPPFQDGKGDGLTGDYYHGTDFNTFRASQVDTTINFDWGTGKPHRLVNPDNFSIRWQGKIQPRFSGAYRFYINSDNGRRLWVNNTLIIDEWVDDYDIEYSGTINLQANELYDIKLEYFESTGGAYCFLEWLNQNQPREIVPKSQLYSLDYSGLNTLDADNGLEIYPNPANGNHINIHFAEQDMRHLTQLKFYDTAGRLIKEERLLVPQTQIDISDLQAGVYFISVQHNDKRSIKKLIIN